MSRPLVSVVMATFNRVHLLERSLEAYARQNFDNKEFELVVIDDHSRDDTDNLVWEWSRRTRIRAVTITSHPKDDDWRDCGAVLNYGIRAAAGEYILLTHPEVIPGRSSVARCVERLKEFEYGKVWRKMANDKGEYRIDFTPGYPPGLYACCRVYYLSPRDQERIDTVPWMSEGNLAVRQIGGFYDEDIGNPDYSHRATDIVAQPGSRLPTWESWVFGGCSRRTWKFLGGMLETQKWGSVDVAFMERRKTLGIPNHTCPEDDTIVVHQCHDLPGDTKTPRDMDAWVRELKNTDLRNQADMCWPKQDHLGWGG